MQQYALAISNILRTSLRLAVWVPPGLADSYGGNGHQEKLSCAHGVPRYAQGLSTSLLRKLWPLRAVRYSPTKSAAKRQLA